MKKELIILLSLICGLGLQSCSDSEKEEVLGAVVEGLKITIFDSDGNCLLDPEFKDNIVSGNVEMIRNGKTYPIIRYTDEDYLWTGAVECLHLAKGEQRPHTICTMLFSPGQWFEEETMIIKWGDNIKNDTIVFTGGITEKGKDYHLTVNGIKLNVYKIEENPYIDDIYLYIKDMTSTNP